MNQITQYERDKPQEVYITRAQAKKAMVESDQHSSSDSDYRSSRVRKNNTPSKVVKEKDVVKPKPIFPLIPPNIPINSEKTIPLEEPKEKDKGKQPVEETTVLPQDLPNNFANLPSTSNSLPTFYRPPKKKLKETPTIPKKRKYNRTMKLSEGDESI